jgi:voltage-gated potassium channel
MSLTTENSPWRTSVSAHLMRASAERTKALTSVRRLLTIEMRHRYTVVLLSIVTSLSLLPFIRGDNLAIFSIKLVLFAILLFGISSGHRRCRDLILGSALGIPVMVGRELPQYSIDIRMLPVMDILWAVFLLYITIMILNQVLSARRVTLDTIAGAACTYFLIGLAAAFVYRAMFVIQPHSFLIESGRFAPVFEDHSRSRPQLIHFVYYSFTTLTTTGFGDITPVSGPSRAISLLEAIGGQFFLAVLIARLVSLELIHSASRDRE